MRIKNEILSSAQYQAQLKAKPKKNKYGAVKVETGGQTFDSTKEAKYAQQLEMQKLLPASDKDKVLSYKTQLTYSLDIAGVHICKYILDFEVEYANRVEHVDVKGYKAGTVYRLFKVKKHLMLALHNINVIEV